MRFFARDVLHLVDLQRSRVALARVVRIEIAQVHPYRQLVRSGGIDVQRDRAEARKVDAAGGLRQGHAEAAVRRGIVGVQFAVQFERGGRLPDRAYALAAHGTIVVRPDRMVIGTRQLQ